MNCFMGIDPGKKGAIAVIHNNECVFKSLIPMIGKEYDIKGIIKQISILKSEYKEMKAVLENPSLIFGASKMADVSLSRCVGMFEGILSTLDVPYIKVAPQKWQGYAWDGVSIIKKSDGIKTDTKKTSMLALSQKYPHIHVDNENGKINDGIVDAALIALYGAKVY